MGFKVVGINIRIAAITGLTLATSTLKSYGHQTRIGVILAIRIEAVGIKSVPYILGIGIRGSPLSLVSVQESRV